MNRLRSQVGLALQFLVLLVRANWDAVAIVVNPRGGESAIVVIDLELEGLRSITVFANVLSLSPGTLTLGISDDRRRLYAHVITTRSIDAIRSELKDLQRRIEDSIR